MLRTRVIPTLLLKDEGLVKTVKFKNPKYIGDPINTVRIFNELEVDELLFLDILASPNKLSPQFKILTEIANECFMPLSYGGGIRDFDTAKLIFDIGFEKVVLNSITHENVDLVTKLSEHYGSQAIVASIDVKQNLWGKYEVWTNNGKKNTKKNPVEWAQRLEELGIGEILLTSIDKEGTWSGFDLNLVENLTKSIKVPLIANGGGGSIEHIADVVKKAKASAVGLGSMVVYQQKDMGVLVNFPNKSELNAILE